MRFMTYNIWNYTRPWTQRRAMIADRILGHRPDVVALQETRHDWRYERGTGQGEQLAELTGYHPTSSIAQVYLPLLRIDEGLTILTREPPVRTFRVELTQFPRERQDENRRICIGVAVLIGGREVHVYDAHFSLSAAARERNAAETFEFIKTQSDDRPTLFMGDLNALPESLPIQFLQGNKAIDGEVGDLLDLWVAANPHDPGFSYASWAPDHRVDYIFGRNLPGSVLSAQMIGREQSNGVYGSDHAGIVVEL